MIQPESYEEEKVSNLQSTFGAIMRLLKYASSMESFQKYVDEHEEVLSNMPVKVAAVLNEFCTLDLTEQELEKGCFLLAGGCSIGKKKESGERIFRMSRLNR